jgi:DNA integrity scanning protein DisA with diadenylate cyclase activity
MSKIMDCIDGVVESCVSFSENKTGALIVFERTTRLGDVIRTGTVINSDPAAFLIKNIFYNKAPLHDGALIISEHKIVAARCTLPITERTDIPANYGMRHKAAIGITEETDADAIVVSEETGRISFVSGGNVTPVTNINELKLHLGASMEK